MLEHLRSVRWRDSVWLKFYTDSSRGVWMTTTPSQWLFLCIHCDRLSKLLPWVMQPLGTYITGETLLWYPDFLAEWIKMGCYTWIKVSLMRVACLNFRFNLALPERKSVEMETLPIPVDVLRWYLSRGTAHLLHVFVYGTWTLGKLCQCWWVKLLSALEFLHNKSKWKSSA